MKDFKGKTAVVTGAATGIGKGLVKNFLAQGMKVVLADIAEENLAKTTAEFKEAGGDVISVITDVSKPGDIAKLAQKTLETYNEVHVVCNNAGIGFGSGLAWQHKIEDWNWVIQVNLMGVVNSVNIFTPIMLNQQTECHIVNTASTAGVITGSGNPTYATTKHALVGFSESLYNDLTMIGAPIGVSVLCPGFVKTDIMNPLKSRPKEMGEVKFAPIPPEGEIIVKALNHAVNTGMEPDVVAQKVLEGIKNNRFYILTHDDTKDFIKTRFTNIMEDKNPAAQFPREIMEYLNQQR